MHSTLYHGISGTEIKHNLIISDVMTIYYKIIRVAQFLIAYSLIIAAALAREPPAVCAF